MVRTEVLRETTTGRSSPKALAGAWYEMLGADVANGRGDKVLAAIAEGSRDTLASYKEQLSTTKMFYTPQAAAQFGASPELKQKMALVRQFCFDHGLLGAKTNSVDDVAIKYPDGSDAGQGRPRPAGLRHGLYGHGGAGEVVMMSSGFSLIHARPGRISTWVISWVLFAAGLAAYFIGAESASSREPRRPRHADRRPDGEGHEGCCTEAGRGR